MENSYGKGYKANPFHWGGGGGGDDIFWNYTIGLMLLAFIKLYMLGLSSLWHMCMLQVKSMAFFFGMLCSMSLLALYINMFKVQKPWYEDDLNLLHLNMSNVFH